MTSKKFTASPALLILVLTAAGPLAGCDDSLSHNGSTGGAAGVGSGGSDGGTSAQAGTSGFLQGPGGAAGKNTAGKGQAGKGDGGTESGGTESGGSGQAGDGDSGSDAGGEAGTGSSVGGSAGSSAGGKAGSGSGGKSGSGSGGKSGSGSGGKAGTSSSGGSGGTPASIEHIGTTCTSDAQCGQGAKCLKSTSTAVFDGGPANGYCTVDCTQWLIDAKGKSSPNLPSPYPCQPDVDINDDTATLSNFCLDFGDETTPQGYCTQLCDFGQPPLTQITGELDTDKCHGRADVGCYPLKDDSGNLSVSFCRPMCQSSTQCSSGYHCDNPSGVCLKGAAPTKKKSGEACDTTATDPCEGACLPLYDASGSESAAKKKHGICIDTCIVNDTSVSCGGASEGLCALNVFGPTDASTQDTIPLGSNDVGGCVKVATDDTDCYWQEGWLTSGSSKLCVPSATCTTSADCSSGLTCQAIPAICNKSFCVDHTVTGLPIGDPGVVCD